MSNLSFADVVDDSILVYVEDKASANDWIDRETGGGSDELAVDLEKQQITYQPRLHKRNEIVARIHLIGSVAEDPRSALWAWANPGFGEAPVAELSTRLRDFGAQNGVAELTTGEIPLPPQEGADDDLGRFANTMAAVACRITGLPFGQIVNTGTTRVVLLVDPAGFVPPAPSGLVFPRILGSALESAWISDHRRAVQGYAQARRLPYGWAPGFTALDLGFPEGNVHVSFDEAGRVNGIEAQFPGAQG